MMMMYVVSLCLIYAVPMLESGSSCCISGLASSWTLLYYMLLCGSMRTVLVLCIKGASHDDTGHDMQSEGSGSAAVMTDCQ